MGGAAVLAGYGVRSGAAAQFLPEGSWGTSGVHLMGHSLHYLPDASQGGVWTAVLDGSGEQPMEGIAAWDGRSNTVATCAFRGDHAFGRAFAGTGANSLRNLIAESEHLTSDAVHSCSRGRGLGAW